NNYGNILTFQNSSSPHLTLQFWKECMEIEYHQILTQCEKIAAASESFSLKLEGIEAFGEHGRTRVLYWSIPFSEDLARLKKRCPWAQGEAFSPHVTLTRVKHPERFAVERKKILKLLGKPLVTLQVDRLRLYAEIDGKKQTPMRDFLFPALSDRALRTLA